MSWVAMSRGRRNKGAGKFFAAVIGVLFANSLQLQPGSVSGAAWADSWTHRQTQALAGIDKISVVITSSGDGAKRLGLPPLAKTLIEDQLRSHGIQVDDLRFVKNVPESATLEIDTRLQLIQTADGKTQGISYAIEGNLLDPVTSSRRNVPKATVAILWRCGQYGFIRGNNLQELNHMVEFVVNQFVIDWQKASLLNQTSMSSDADSAKGLTAKPGKLAPSAPDMMASPAASSAAAKPMSKWKKAQLAAQQKKAGMQGKPTPVQPAVVSTSAEPSATLANSLFDQAPPPLVEAPVAKQPVKAAVKPPSKHAVKGKAAAARVANKVQQPSIPAASIEETQDSRESFTNTAAVFGDPIPAQPPPPPAPVETMAPPVTSISLPRKKEPPRVDTKAALMLQKQNAIIRQNQAIISKQQEVLAHNHNFLLSEQAKDIKKGKIKVLRPPRRVNATFPTAPGQQSAAPGDAQESPLNLFQ